MDSVECDVMGRLSEFRRTVNMPKLMHKTDSVVRVKQDTVGYCARWKQNNILSNLAVVEDAVEVTEIKLSDGTTMKSLKFPTVEHAYVGMEKFRYDKKAVSLLVVGGIFSSFEEMHKHHIETHDLKVE